ncbi:hypothetical protein Raf01_90660 [Rugosimonospora africana]|uniref:Uncharacterized protein n=1 Tax=Rugosimonospora africana TaxID=556532 RepID=A0A8J3R332_9ACTN|nr:hypothetical protein Raf01_90660 [Rugosimonospora africana]
MAFAVVLVVLLHAMSAILPYVKLSLGTLAMAALLAASVAVQMMGGLTAVPTLFQAVMISLAAVLSALVKLLDDQQGLKKVRTVEFYSTVDDRL